MISREQICHEQNHSYFILKRVPLTLGETKLTLERGSKSTKSPREALLRICPGIWSWAPRVSENRPFFARFQCWFVFKKIPIWVSPVWTRPQWPPFWTDYNGDLVPKMSSYRDLKNMVLNRGSIFVISRWPGRVVFDFLTLLLTRPALRAGY